MLEKSILIACYMHVLKGEYYSKKIIISWGGGGGIKFWNFWGQLLGVQNLNQSIDTWPFSQTALGSTD